MQYPQYFIGNFIHACTGLFAFSFLDFCSMNRSIVTFIYSLNRINYAKSKKLRRFGSSTVDVKQTFVINYSSTLGFCLQIYIPYNAAFKYIRRVQEFTADIFTICL